MISLQPQTVPIKTKVGYTWGDWFGTDEIANQDKIPFEEARSFARSLNLTNKDAWRAWAKSNARSIDIPANPQGTYQDQGWRGWGDWLGTVNLWNKNAVLSFLYSIKPILQNLQPAELYTIMRQNGMITA